MPGTPGHPLPEAGKAPRRMAPDVKITLIQFPGPYHREWKRPRAGPAVQGVLNNCGSWSFQTKEFRTQPAGAL